MVLRPNIGVRKYLRKMPRTHWFEFACQAGSMMIEALGMLGLLAITTPLLFKKSIDRQNELTDISVANQTRTLINSLQSFVAEYEDSIKTCVSSIRSGEAPVEGDAGYEEWKARCDESGLSIHEYSEGALQTWAVDMLKEEFEKHLPIGFNTSNKMLEYKASIRVDIRNEEPVVVGMVISNKSSDIINAQRGARIASMIGVSGGFIMPEIGEENFEASGASGAWKLDVKDFFPEEIEGFEFGESSVVGLTGYSEVSGGSGGGGVGECPNCLYKIVKDGSVTYNTMQTNIYMGSNIGGTYDGPHSIFSYQPDVGDANPLKNNLNAQGGQIDMRGNLTQNSSGSASGGQDVYANVDTGTGEYVDGTGRNLPKYQFLVNTAARDISFVKLDAASTTKGIAKTADEQSEQLSAINNSTVSLTKSLNTREGEIRLNYFEGGYYYNPTTDNYEYIPPGTKAVKGGDVGNIHIYSSKGDGDEWDESLEPPALVYKGRKSGNIYMHDGGRILVNAKEEIGDEYKKETELVEGVDTRVSDYEEAAAPGSVNVYSNAPYEVDIDGTYRSVEGTGLYNQASRAVGTDALSVHQKSGGIALKQGKDEDGNLLGYSGSLDVAGGQIRIESTSAVDSGSLIIRRNENVNSANLMMLGSGSDAAVGAGDVLSEGGRMILLHTGSFASNTYGDVLTENDVRGSIYLHGGQIKISDDDPTGLGGVGTDEITLNTVEGLSSLNSLSDIDWSGDGNEVDEVSSIGHDFTKTVSKGTLRVEGSDSNYSGQMRIIGGAGVDAGGLVMDANNTQNAKIELFGQKNMLDRNGDGGFTAADLINPNDLKVGSLESSPVGYNPADYEYRGLEISEFNNPDVYQFKVSGGGANDLSTSEDYNLFSQGAGNVVIAGGRGASSGVLKIYGGDIGAGGIGGENTGQVRLYGSSGANSGSLVTFGGRGIGSGSLNMFAGSGVNSGNINLVARDTRHLASGGDERALKGGSINLDGGDISMKAQTYPAWDSDAEFQIAAARLALANGGAGVEADDTAVGGVKITNAGELQSWYEGSYAGKTKAGVFEVGAKGKVNFTTDSTLHIQYGATAQIDGNLLLNGGLTLTETPQAADQVNMALNPSSSGSSKFMLQIMRGPVMGNTASGKVANVQPGEGSTVWVPPGTSTKWGCQLWNKTTAGGAWAKISATSSTSGTTCNSWTTVCSGWSSTCTAWGWDTCEYKVCVSWWDRCSSWTQKCNSWTPFSKPAAWYPTAQGGAVTAGTLCYFGPDDTGWERCYNATTDHTNGSEYTATDWWWYWEACSTTVDRDGYWTDIPGVGSISSSSGLKTDYFDGNGYAVSADKYFHLLTNYLDEAADEGDISTDAGTGVVSSVSPGSTISRSTFAMRRSKFGALKIQGGEGDYSGQLIVEGGSGENSGSIIMDANNTNTGGKIILYGSRSRNTYYDGSTLMTRWQNPAGNQTPFAAGSPPPVYPDAGFTGWGINARGHNPYMSDPDDYQFALYGNDTHYSGHAAIVGGKGVASGQLKMVGGEGNESGTLVGLGGAGYHSGGIMLHGSSGPWSGGLMTRPGSGVGSGGIWLGPAYWTAKVATDEYWLSNMIMTGDPVALNTNAGNRYFQFAVSGESGTGGVNIPASGSATGYASNYSFTNAVVPKGNRGGDIVLGGGNVILASPDEDMMSGQSSANPAASGSLIVKGGSVSLTRNAKIISGSNTLDPAKGMNLKRSYLIDEDGFVRYEKQTDVQLGYGGVVGMPASEALALKEQLLANKKANLAAKREEQRKILKESGPDALGLSEEDLEKFLSDPTAVIGSDGTLRSASRASDAYDARFDENRLNPEEFGDLEKLSDKDSYYSEGVLNIDGGGVLVTRPKGKYTASNNDEWGFIRTTSGNIIADDGVVKVDSASKDYVNAGYVKARRLVSGIRYVDPIQGKCKASNTDSGFYGCQNGMTTYGDDEGYDYYEVNPAFTSVMKDIKLSSRGGARISELIPNFIAKGIYDFRSKYQGPWIKKDKKIVGWSAEHLPVNFPSMEIDKKKVDECIGDACETSAWLGFVPAPMCPRNGMGYKPIITLAQTHSVFSPSMFALNKDNQAANSSERIRSFLGAEPFCIAKGKKVDNHAKDYQVDCETGESIRVKADGTIKKGSKREVGQFLGWSILMGFTKQSEPGAEAIINPFPVYKDELGAIAHSYCYFDRKWQDKEGNSFNPDIVDVNYDPNNNWGYYKQKPSNIHSNYYSEEYKDNMMGINGRDDPALYKRYSIPDAGKKSGKDEGYVKSPKASPWYYEKLMK